MIEEKEEHVPQGNVWDHRDEIGFLPAFGRSVVEASIHPFSFFGEMRRGPEFGGALLFVAAIGLIVGFIEFFWDVMGIGFGLMFSELESGYDPSLAADVFTSPFAIVLTPIMMVIAVFISAGILHLCLMLFGAARAGFENTLKVVCLAEAPMVLAVVPICGSQIGMVWSLVLLGIGVMAVHGATALQAIGAMVLPFVVCCGSGLALAMVFGFGLALFGLGAGS